MATVRRTEGTIYRAPTKREDGDVKSLRVQNLHTPKPRMGHPREQIKSGKRAGQASPLQDQKIRTEKYAQPRVAVPPREQRSEGRNTHRKRDGALKGAATIRRTEGTIFRLLPGISDIVPLQSEKMAT